MKPISPPIRPPFKTHGGKHYLAPKLIEIFREHDAYVEPFVGGGNVLLNKPKSRVEIACDLNPMIIRVWNTIKNYSYMLLDTLKTIVVNEDSFIQSKRILDYYTQKESISDYEMIDVASSYIVRSRFSRGGYGEKWCHSQRYRGGNPEQVNSWKTFVNDALPRIAERIQDVQFYCSDFRELFVRKSDLFSDDPLTLIYCDPPYLNETRTDKKTYGQYEMSDQDHADLLEILLDRNAKVYISGYWSNLYGEKLYNWKLRSWDMPNHSSQKKMKSRRVECLWENPY